MIHSVRSYIEKFQLLEENQPVLVGLSGGADSVALLGILVRLGYKCIAVHCNFHLRGDEANRDEDFSWKIANLLHVPFYKVDFDTIGYAEQKHLSVEMAARELRYDWFEKMRKRLNAQAVAVAHHRDDSIETVLMNLIRGSGVRGLGGIRPKNGFVVRPLLCVSRLHILSWLEDQGLSYVTDSTNLSDAYTRNFIRLNVLPLLEKINPSVRTTIARSAEHLAAAESLYLYALDLARKEIEISKGRFSIKALKRFPASETILYEILKEFGFSRIVSDNIFSTLNKESGKMFYSPSHQLVKDRDDLLVMPLVDNEVFEYQVNIDQKSIEIPINLSFNKIRISSESNFSYEKNKKVAYFDLDKLSFPLTLRHWKQGDYFIPFGMKGRKKVSDYFSDHKLSRFQKKQFWILCSEESIIWLVGERADNRFRVDDKTKTVLMIKSLD